MVSVASQSVHPKGAIEVIVEVQDSIVPLRLRESASAGSIGLRARTGEVRRLKAIVVERMITISAFLPMKCLRF